MRKSRGSTGGIFTWLALISFNRELAEARKVICFAKMVLQPRLDPVSRSVAGACRGRHQKRREAGMPALQFCDRAREVLEQAISSVAGSA
jgi:hypothetical protein